MRPEPGRIEAPPAQHYRPGRILDGWDGDDEIHCILLPLLSPLHPCMKNSVRFILNVNIFYMRACHFTFTPIENWIVVFGCLSIWCFIHIMCLEHFFSSPLLATSAIRMDRYTSRPLGLLMLMLYIRPVPIYRWSTNMRRCLYFDMVNICDDCETTLCCVWRPSNGKMVFQGDDRSDMPLKCYFSIRPHSSASFLLLMPLLLLL